MPKTEKEKSDLPRLRSYILLRIIPLGMPALPSGDGDILQFISSMPQLANFFSSDLDIDL